MWRNSGSSAFADVFSGSIVVKNLLAKAGDTGDTRSVPGSGRSPQRRKWEPMPVLSPGESHGERSLAGYSPWGHRSQT